MVLGGDNEAKMSLPALRQRALEAETRGDVYDALQCWRLFRESAPNARIGYVVPLRMLRQAKRFDLATQLVTEALARFPNDEGVLVSCARLADSTKRVEDADRFWQRIVAIRPDNREYSLAACRTLTRTKEGREKQIPLILKRFAIHHKRFPDHAAAYCAHIDTILLSKEVRGLATFYNLDALSRAWCARFDKNADIALARVALLEGLGRTDTALAEVADLRSRLSLSPRVEAVYMRMLSCTRRMEEADKVFSHAIAFFPNDKDLLLEHARVASRHAEWLEVERRLLAAQAVLAGDNQIARELQLIRQMLAGSNSTISGPAARDVASSNRNEPNAQLFPEAALMSKFVSLGGGGMGCEFGMLQRQMGSDRVSLLRWSEVGPADLIAALACEFEGVGDEANTELRVARHGPCEEYVTRDKRFAMGSHTFVKTTDAPADRMLTQSCRRLRFLRNKLLEQLRLSEKIFVYRAQDPIVDDDILSLRKGVARYGDNALLCVTRGNSDHSPGSLRVLAQGVFTGYVAHFHNQAGDAGGTGTDISGWLAICKQADAIWYQTRT